MKGVPARAVKPTADRTTTAAGRAKDRMKQQPHILRKLPGRFSEDFHVANAMV